MLHLVGILFPRLYSINNVLKGIFCVVNERCSNRGVECYGNGEEYLTL